MKQLRVAILGQGRSGFGIHYNQLRKDVERYKVVAVADLIPERCREAAEESGAKVYSDYKDLITECHRDIDLLVNALPSNLHVPVTIEAFKYGMNVVCEKPLARRVSDFDDMVKAGVDVGKTLLPFQNSRFQPAFQKILDVLSSGVLGELVHARISFSGFARRWDWQCLRKLDGGNLLNTGPHPVDQAVVLFGKKKPNVFARLVSKNPYGDAENFATVTLWAPESPTVEVVVSSFMAYPQGEMYNLSCTNGGLSGSLTELKWRYFIPDLAPEHSRSEGWSDNRQYCNEKLTWVEESWKIGDDQPVFDIICARFYDDAYGILVEGKERLITLEQVRSQIEVMEEAHRQNPDLI
jgi:scyllo-inositol 2-dehydrogenase (NADP+)